MKLMAIFKLTSAKYFGEVMFSLQSVLSFIHSVSLTPRLSIDDLIDLLMSFIKAVLRQYLGHFSFQKCLQHALSQNRQISCRCCGRLRIVEAPKQWSL